MLKQMDEREFNSAVPDLSGQHHLQEPAMAVDGYVSVMSCSPALNVGSWTPLAVVRAHKGGFFYCLDARVNRQ